MHVTGNKTLETSFSFFLFCPPIHFMWFLGLSSYSVNMHLLIAVRRKTGLEMQLSVS